MAKATIKVSEMDTMFDSYSNAVSPDLMLICEGNQIEIQFVESALTTKAFDQLLGRNYELTMINVQDNANNIMEEYKYQSTFACHPPQPEIVISHPAGNGRHYLPDQAILFEATLRNTLPAGESKHELSSSSSLHLIFLKYDPRELG